MPRVDIWTDGSGTRTEGPACIGVVVLVDGVPVCEASEHVGTGTNNVAELRAIRRGLYLAAEIVGYGEATIVHSDSEYAIGMVTRDWRPTANASLVHAIRHQAEAFTRLRWEHVEGHAGTPLNELADWLAGRARVAFLRSQGVERKLKRRPDAGADSAIDAVA